MTTTSGNIPLTDLRPDGGGGGAPVVQIPEHLRLAAAARLLPDQSGDPTLAAQRFLESASAMRIDLNLMWGTIIPGTSLVRQVCLAVMGSGRTAMLFVSGAERRGRAWTAAARVRGAIGIGSPEISHVERVSLIHHACTFVAEPGPHEPHGGTLAQALLEAREKEAMAAFREAGFTALGELVYMRRTLSKDGPGLDVDLPDVACWPNGVRVLSVAELLAEGIGQGQIDEWLRVALERSYVDTLDCPELCGMRSVQDVLTSHKAVGVYDPGIWWIAFDDNGPQGCLLLTVCPEHDSVELVYLGLAPALRGKGLGWKLMAYGMSRLYEHNIGNSSPTGRPFVRGSGGLTCAVDARNLPAMRLYKRLGFSRFGQRLPYVKGLRRGDEC